MDDRPDQPVTLLVRPAALPDDTSSMEPLPCRLSGDLVGDDGPDFENNLDNSYHVVTGNDADKTAVLDGFVIIAGNATEPFSNDRGGGLHAEDASAAIRSCVFKTNTAERGGGAYTNGGHPSFLD